MMFLNDFPYTIRWDMVRAYPVISEIPDARTATADDIDAGFRRIMRNQNLAATLEAYLAANPPPSRTHDGIRVEYAIHPVHTDPDPEETTNP